MSVIRHTPYTFTAFSHLYCKQVCSIIVLPCVLVYTHTLKTLKIIEYQLSNNSLCTQHNVQSRYSYTCYFRVHGVVYTLVSIYIGLPHNQKTGRGTRLWNCGYVYPDPSMICKYTSAGLSRFWNNLPNELTATVSLHSA